MQLTSDERRRARFRKVLRLLRHPVTWKVIVMVAQALARISHTFAGAGLVLAAPTGFRTLRIHPVLAAARKPAGTAMPYAIIPQTHEKCGLAWLWDRMYPPR